MQLRRSAAITFRFGYVPTSGDEASCGPAPAMEERLVAISLRGEAHPLHEDDLRVLSSIPSQDWVDFDDSIARLNVDPGVIERLLDAGLLLCDAADGPLAERTWQEQRFSWIDWHDGAAHYHMVSRVRDQDAAHNIRPGELSSADIGPARGAAMGTPAPGASRAAGGPVTASAQAALQASSAPATQLGAVDEFAALAMDMSNKVAAQAAQKGPPPSPFHEVAGVISRHTLPDPRTYSSLTQTLTDRRTIRVFDQTNPLTVQELSTLLYYTFGAQGVSQSPTGHWSLSKTSPSGGAMHPIEAYPLIINVRDQPSGLYHYSVQRHMLELLRPMHPLLAERTAEVFALGQSYFRSANAMFILTARWYRSFWKYPRAHKAYRVVHLDAGHLSQTLYILCTHLGLGAFFTGAVNDMNIEEMLGLDPLQEGVIGISGCGRPLNGGNPLTLQTVPYTPRPY